ncbi:alpha/beta fold hydrolase [Crenothrix sp.]|uniref:alpha/beta fold hydrolase n=1 Tax=Crenothrix sp. TaxID=3100433 RepID=UPI00374CF1CE
MNTIKGIPYSTAEFDKEGKLLSQPIVPAGTTDLIVMSHGWNNNRIEAEALYTKLFSNFVDVTATDSVLKQRKLAIIGVIWPSKKFDEFMTQPDNNKVAGGAASAGSVKKAASEATMHAAIDLSAQLFNDAGDAERIATLHKLVPKLEDDTDAQKDFVKTLRSLLDPNNAHTSEQSKNDGSAVFFRAQAEVIFNRAAASSVETLGVPIVHSQTPGDSMGQAAGIGSFFSGATHAVSNLLNLTTYFEMKQRAGTVGKIGLVPLLDKLASQVERIHLAGHSFGARVVTAAAANSTTNKLYSLSLLQAAFSHNGFSLRRQGFFRSVVNNKRISGPILVTYSNHDKAVGIAYPSASRISRDSAAALGDANDEFGGLGSNGAQQMEVGEVVSGVKDLLPVGQAYSWQMGKFHNLDSSKFIIDPKGGDAHGFVFVPQVAWAISRAIVS